VYENLFQPAVQNDNMKPIYIVVSIILLVLAILVVFAIATGIMPLHESFLNIMKVDNVAASKS